MTLNNTTDSDVGTGWSFGPLVRINPRPGWRFASAFNWYNADLDNPAGGGEPFARFNIRPVMGGIGYTLGPPKTLVNFSVVMGPSFNRAYFRDGFPDAAGSSIEAKTSFAFRPGISVTQTLATRVGFTAFAGYMVNRPKVTYRSNTGQQVQDRWRADSDRVERRAWSIRSSSRRVGGRRVGDRQSSGCRPLPLTADPPTATHSAVRICNAAQLPLRVRISRGWMASR